MSQLTRDQREAREVILTRVMLQGLCYTSLKGYAGTGKTYLAATLAEDLRRYGVYACAPTHKAAHVLESKLPVSAQTIHAFLGLKVIRDGKGGYKLVPDKYKRCEVPDEGIVILDEASMIGSQLWHYIEKAPGLRWIFIGDPAQLPPVKEKPSKALNQDGAELSQIVRQAEDNPIIRFSQLVREGKPYLDATGFTDGVGVAVTQDSGAFMESVVGLFKGVDASRPPDARVLAYRNEVVRSYNTRIRRQIHGAATKAAMPRFLPGDWLMMRDTYFENSAPVARNSEEVLVVGSVDEDFVTAAGFFRIHRVTARREDMTRAAFPVLHASEEARFERITSRYREEAASGERPWSDYYDLVESFAEVDYAYAMTTHKSQGSTFHTVYVDHRDLMSCKVPSERKSLVYVACTRPSHRLAILA